MSLAKKSSLKDKLLNLPQTPGVYIYKDMNGEIIYVGKAKNIRNRVRSYFVNRLDPNSKTKALVDRINDIEIVEVESELEALLLEAELIKIHTPKYNINLKDDKSYLYIVIRNEQINVEAMTFRIKKVVTARKSDLKPKDVSFGPYPDASNTKYVVRLLRKVFPYRDCSSMKFTRYHKIGRSCLYGHLGLCQSPCIKSGNNLEYKEKIQDYNKDINKLVSVLSGKSSVLLNELNKKMLTASQNQNFEEALRIRDLLRKFNYIRQTFKNAQSYIDNPYLVEDVIDNSLLELKRHLPMIKTTLSRIECFDISNISGKEAVGAMTVAIEGRMQSSKYRKFKIRLKDTPDDFSMLTEVLTRRIKRAIDESPGWELPDLIIIDGGKGQVSAVAGVLERFGITVPLIGIAKKFETLVFIQDAEFKEIRLDLNNEGLKLVQRLRDEAHRFGKKYHHQLRLKGITK